MSKKTKIREIQRLIETRKNSPLANLDEAEVSLLKKHGVSLGRIALGEGFIESVQVADEQEANQLLQVLRKFVGLCGWHNGVVCYWVKSTEPRKPMPWDGLYEQMIIKGNVKS